ncbi:tyrosine-type recombinase/integrase [Bacteroides thetaiotaomicron]|nr:tyrosine-type recombinase/integrase [Bacteroides thetaiotaomicron]
MYERKQNGEVFFSSLCVTYSRFGNYPANGLVTEQPQYSVVVCIFHILQNTEIQLISNDLRLIFTCSLLLASPCIFHVARHTFGTLMVSAGVPMESISKMMGHTNIRTTQGYAKVTDDKISEDMDKLMKRRKRIFNKSSLLGGL